MNGVRIGMVTFDRSANIQFHLNENYDKNNMINKILTDVDHCNPLAGTNTSGALWLMRTQIFDPTAQNQNGDRSGVPDVAILITNDKSDVDSQMVRET